MPLSRFRTNSWFKAIGFRGFHTVRDLRLSRLADVPAAPGVYIILRPTRARPRFLAKSSAGKFKGRDPTVPRARLRSAWLPGSPLLYVGKAGARGQASTMRARLRLYLANGEGRPAPHWGGRFIWQLARSADLVVAWKSAPAGSPRLLERILILEFEALFGARPFANRVR